MNNTVAHFSPLVYVRNAYEFTYHRLRTYCLTSSDPLASQTLAKDDVVKLHLGAHIDGFAAISAETIVVGATENDPVTGKRADVLKAAYQAAELAMRLVKVGNKNWAVTEAVSKAASAFNCKPVEGMSLLPVKSISCRSPPRNRNAIVPAHAKRHRWQKTYHTKPHGNSKTGLGHSNLW